MQNATQDTWAAQATEQDTQMPAAQARPAAHDISRRGFIGAMGAAAAAAAAIPVINVAHAESADESASVPEDATAPVRTTGFANNEFLEQNRDTLAAMVRDCPVATEDLTLPDGRVIDKVYVTLWNRLNRLSNGLNNTPGAYSFDLLLELFTPEDAEHWNELPLLERFSAYDYACLTDRTEAEALDILNDLASRRLINRTTRVGVDWFYVYSWPGALIPNLYSRIDKDFIEKNDRLMGVDAGNGAQYPIYDVYPVSADVVEGSKLLPYRDWRAIFERNTIFAAQPCGCRNKAILRGHEEEHEEGICHCMVFGEMAQFLIETGIPALTKEQAIAEAEKLIDYGYVPEGAYAEYPDIMCFCRSDNCALLTPCRNLQGETGTFPNATAYLLDYDREKCVQCGACVSRCPLEAVRQDEDGYCIVDKWCVGCGQCVLVCPADARILKAKPQDEIPPKPQDLLDQILWSSVDRMATNRIVDFEGTELPTYAVEASLAADEATHANYNWLIDQKPTASPTGCADGTYEVTRNGLGGPMTVSVEIAGDVITRVTVGEHHETPIYGTRALDQLPAAIVAANGLDVDTVSGATHTSIALLKAVDDCLHQAGMQD